MEDNTGRSTWHGSLEAFAQNALDVFYRFRLVPTLGFEFVNKAITRLTGYTPEEHYANPLLGQKLLHPADLRKLEDWLFSSGSQEIPLTLRWVTKDNRLIWTEHTIVRYYDEVGELIYVEGVARDVTGKMTLEKEIARTERLHLIGEMAVGIGHELRNPMTTVRGFLQVFQQKPEFASYKEQLGLMIDELDAANAIISEFVSLAKGRATERVLTCLNSIILAVYPLLQAMASEQGKYVRLELMAAKNLLLDDKQIRQLILNLAKNGIEAMQKGQQLTIRTFAEAEDVILAIVDEGSGIDPQYQEQIAIPFFSTKDYGTGLGLPVCYSIADRHEAKLYFETSKQGTTFFVRFERSC